MTEDKIQRLRDAGISEEVIMDMMKKPEEPRSDGYIDPATPSSTFTQAQATGAPTQGPEQTWAQTGAEIGVLTPDILKYATAAGLGAGAYKLGKGILQGRSPAPVATTPATPVATAAPSATAFEARPMAPSTPTSGQQFTDWYKQGVKDTAMRRTIAPMTGSMAMAPFAAPYLGAAYEQAQIRQNPNAPQYTNNPYAMMVRGQAPTMGAAGAMNTRQAIAGQQYGGLTAEQQAMLEQDKIDQAIRRKAASKVLGPIAPGQ